MEITRAREILQSPNTIQVLYQGSPVWIEDINETNYTVDVTIMDIHQKASVPVDQLFERL